MKQGPRVAPGVDPLLAMRLAGHYLIPSFCFANGRA